DKPAPSRLTLAQEARSPQRPNTHLTNTLDHSQHHPKIPDVKHGQGQSDVPEMPDTVLDRLATGRAAVVFAPDARPGHAKAGVQDAAGLRGAARRRGCGGVEVAVGGGEGGEVGEVGGGEGGEVEGGAGVEGGGGGGGGRGGKEGRLGR
ncbi:hypothetical protein HDU93_001871, partial [Gonapodya sp. JEL0774]